MKVLRLEALEARDLLHAESVSLFTPHLLHEHQDLAPTSTLFVQTADVAAVTPDALLPDLFPWVDESRGFLYGWTVQNNELRLTTSVANNGPGALELRGGATLPEGNQEVNQRIYEPDGTFTDVLVGTFTYHPDHKHIHFDGFAQFQLREVLPDGGVGNILAGGTKTSFCILDLERYDSSTGPAKYLNCRQVQGLSPGWSDLYDKGLDGQSIDITSIQNGTYWLEMVVDPDNRIIEADESNNVARILIDLDRDGAPTNADPFEPNDSFVAASILAPPEDHMYDNLSIHESGNFDYYRVTASATGKLAVSLAFQNSQGDIELAVYDADQTRLGISQTAGNSEKVTVNAVAGEIFYIRVWGYDGATNPNYSMLVDQPETDEEGAGDAYEDNDTFSAAKSLEAIDQVYSDLSILRTNDDDYYSLVPTVSGSLEITIAFLNSQGDLELELYDAAQSRLAGSETAGDSEQVKVPVTAGQTYYVRVFGYDGATNPNYSMTVDWIEAGSSTVYYLSTTGGGSLSSTDGSPNLSFSDADILKLTVMGNGQYGYGIHFDGSDVGLTTSAEDIDAFAFRADGSILISTFGSFSVPAPGGGSLTGNREDLLLFTPTSLGETTSGEWSLFFDGSDVGLSTKSENIDAVAQLSDGRLIVSTNGGFTVPGVSGADEDLIIFTPTSVGSTTAGTWSLYFDGSDVGLANDTEDVNALFVRESEAVPTLFLSTVGNISVPGVSGANNDVVEFNPASLGADTAGVFGPGLALDGSRYGLASFAVDGVHVGAPPVALQVMASGGSDERMELPLVSVATVERQRPAFRPALVSTRWSAARPSDSIALTTALSRPISIGAVSSATKESGWVDSDDAEKNRVAGIQSIYWYRRKLWDLMVNPLA